MTKHAAVPTGPEFKIVDVNPSVALEWLAHNHDNRTVSTDRVRQYADQMRRGQWRLTGDAVRFDTTDRLVDGQHRLLAVLEAAAGDTAFSVQMAVIFGLAPETFQVIDTGYVRRPGDVLGFGTKGRQRMAAMIRVLYVVDAGADPRNAADLNSVTRVDIADYHEANESLCHAANVRGGELYGAIKGNFTAWAAFSFLAMRATYDTPNAGLVGEFLDGVKYGVGLGAGDPRLAYRNFLMNKRELPNAGHHLHLIIKVWNYWLQGRQMQVMTTRGDEPWPVLSTEDRRASKRPQEDES